MTLLQDAPTLVRTVKTDAGIRSLLVHVEASPEAAPRLDVAVDHEIYDSIHYRRGFRLGDHIARLREGRSVGNRYVLRNVHGGGRWLRLETAC